MALTLGLSLSCKKKEEQEKVTPVVETCSATIKDIDGHTYKVIKIGSQCWMQENLKTSRYKDGAAITTGLSASEWTNTTQGAFAIYEDKADNNDTYGKLYNGHAVATGKLCPEGWRIPTDEDFKVLEKHLGLPDDQLNLTGERGNAEAIGGKMKSTLLWDSPNAGANNSSGFSALPAGTRNSVGDYIVLKQYATFWTSTPYATDSSYLWNHHLYYNGAGVGRIYETKNRGYSCRCIKN